MRHAEAVLLVDDGQRQIFKKHLVLDHRVGADHQPGFAAFNFRQGLPALFGFLAAGEPGGLDTQWLEPADQLSKMLLSEDFGRRHECALPAGVNAARCGQRGHHGFAGADVALQQAVHRNTFLQIGSYLSADALLR